jgi:hypothetical protein
MLCRLYILAERMQYVHAKNSVVDAMHNFMGEFVPKNALKGPCSAAQEPVYTTTLVIKALWEGTQKDSPARRLVFDLYLRGPRKGKLAKRRFQTASSSIWRQK